MKMKIKGIQTGSGKRLSGTYTVPGDKSISHRSVMLGSLAQGTTEVSGFLTGEDCLSTIQCFRALGIDIQLNGTDCTIHGTGTLSPPSKILDVGNSGTTLRLISGILAGQPFSCTITGDESIQKRPMKRVVDPLTLMGAKFNCKDGGYAPITITGTQLKGIRYTLPVASAQVKSAVLLASLYAEGETVVEEPIPTRDHTEIMLRYLGADIKKEPAIGNISADGNISASGNLIVCKGKPILKAQPISVPGDISSAAFLMAAAAILPGSHIKINRVGVNPTRTGVIHVLKRMGANIKLKNERICCGEKVADIEIHHAPLCGTIIEGAEIPTLIDEIPILAVVALFAKGETIVRDATELRVKEVDRIKVVADEFNKFFDGDNSNQDTLPIVPQEDGMKIHGCIPMSGVSKFRTVNSSGDHRLAMSLSVLSLAVPGESEIENAECADISFPGFYELLLNGVY